MGEVSPEKGNLIAIEAFEDFLTKVNSFVSIGSVLEKVKVKNQKDARKNPAAIVFSFLACVWTGASNIASFHRSIDKLKKACESVSATADAKMKEIAKDFYACYDTLRDYLRTLRLDCLQGVHDAILKEAHHRKYLQSDRFQKKMVAIIDGTHMFNSMWACVLAIAGAETFLAGFSVYKKGKELVAAKAVLRNFAQEWLLAGIYVVVADGLYLAESMFKIICNELGKHVLVKITDRKKDRKKKCKAYRKILKTAEEEIGRHKKGNKLQQAKSVKKKRVNDMNRNRQYDVYEIRGLKFAGIPVLVCYAMPLFKYVDAGKKHKAEPFFVVTTISNVDEAILLATERWRIEEHFDIIKNEFNVRTDFIYSGDLKAFRRLFTMLMIAVNMIMVYKILRTKEKRSKRKINLSELIQRLRDGFVEYVSRITCAISPELAARTRAATTGITGLLSAELTNPRSA